MKRSNRYEDEKESRIEFKVKINEINGLKEEAEKWEHINK